MRNNGYVSRFTLRNSSPHPVHPFTLLWCLFHSDLSVPTSTSTSTRLHNIGSCQLNITYHLHIPSTHPSSTPHTHTSHVVWMYGYVKYFIHCSNITMYCCYYQFTHSTDLLQFTPHYNLITQSPGCYY